MAECLSGDELVALVKRVFQPRENEKGIAILVDLPDACIADNPDWATRRDIAADWLKKLAGHQAELGLTPSLVLYRNAHSNNGDLPERCWIHTRGPLPKQAEDLAATRSIPFVEVFSRNSILLVPSEFSATAPLKMAAKVHLFRAATMGGFCEEMIPALRLDYVEINRRVACLADLLDRACGADLRFTYPGGETALYLDLRFRKAHASSGMLPNPGTAGNLPSGEAYIVPFEGETGPSNSAGILPVQIGQDVVLYRIENNKAIEVLSTNSGSRTEAEHLLRETAYGNIAELGLGVLGTFGVKAIGKILLDEKLGLHIAFGRSDHFGGQVGPKDFSSPDEVTHIDRVYVAETQPDVIVKSADLLLDDESRVALIRNGHYSMNFD